MSLLSVGVLRLDQPRGAVVFGSTVRLAGIARGLPSPVLSSSPDGSAATCAGGAGFSSGSSAPETYATPATATTPAPANNNVCTGLIAIFIVPLAPMRV